MLGDILRQLPDFLNPYNLLLLGQALVTTLGLAVAGCLASFPLGLLLALARRSRGVAMLPLRLLALLYIEIFRRVPFLVTLMLFFFGSQVIGLDLPAFVVALISVCVIGTAFTAEIIRGGLASVPAPQLEAAETMNFGPTATLFLVVLPQAWPVILPPVFGYFVLLIKDTALASQAGVLELTQAGKILNDKGFPAFLVFGTVLLLYFLVSYPLARLGASLEARLGASRHSRS